MANKSISRGRNILAETDVLAGIAFMVIGAGGWSLTRDLSLGTVLMIGSGFMPQAVSSLLFLFGVVIAFGGVRNASQKVEIGSLRPLLTVTLCIAVFALTLERFGLIVSVLLVVALSPLAGSKPKPMILVIVGLMLAALCTGIFVYGAKLPINAGPF